MFYLSIPSNYIFYAENVMCIIGAILCIVGIYIFATEKMLYKSQKIKLVMILFIFFLVVIYAFNDINNIVIINFIQ